MSRSSPLRFTFVLTRYGSAVLGGGEKHAREVAERLAARGHDVEVLTTTATSYKTWENELPVGRELINGVEVQRYAVRRGRRRPLDEIAKAAACRLRNTDALGRLWCVTQGPIAPDLVEACAKRSSERDLLVFFSWLYHPHQQALARIGGRSALVPLVHDEPPSYTSLARDTLRRPAMLLVNTEEEWARIERITKPSTPPGAIVAVGREQPVARDPSFSPPVTDPYLLVLGRAGKAKPVLAVWRRVVELAKASKKTIEIEPGRRVPCERLKLLVVGEASRKYEGIPNVAEVGFVDDPTRWQLLWHATALVNPSVHESLSLVLLEAWSCARPVVVNTACDVTVGQCRRSQGGFGIDFARPALAAVDLLEGLESFERRAHMGSAGAAYVERRYAWDRVLDAYEAAALAVRDGGPVARALAPWGPPTLPSPAFSAAPGAAALAD